MRGISHPLSMRVLRSCIGPSRGPTKFATTGKWSAMGGGQAV